MHEHYGKNANELIGCLFGDRKVTNVFYKKRKSKDKIRSDWYYTVICSKGHQASLRKIDLKSVCVRCYIPHNKKTSLRGTSIYNIWKAMRQRCMNKNSFDYKWYGGRGITICDRWNVFNNFFEDMGHKPEGKSLDRIDNDFGYSPENCKWSTQKEQVNNSRVVKKD